MRIIFVSSLLFTVFLASCASTPTSEPVPSAIAISPTMNLRTTMEEPTITPKPTNTPTPTEVVIPDQLREYSELGYDNPSDGQKYVVVDESSVRFSDINGIVYKERVIRSWYEVHYIDENGVPQQGFVLGFIRRGGSGSNADYSKKVTSNSGALVPNGSVAFVQSQENGSINMSPSAFPIYRAIFGVEEGNWVSEHMFNDFFPVADGAPQPVTIPGIGLVLPITRLSLVDSFKAQQP